MEKLVNNFDLIAYYEEGGKGITLGKFLEEIAKIKLKTEDSDNYTFSEEMKMLKQRYKRTGEQLQLVVPVRHSDFPREDEFIELIKDRGLKPITTPIRRYKYVYLSDYVDDGVISEEVYTAVSRMNVMIASASKSQDVDMDDLDGNTPAPDFMDFTTTGMRARYRPKYMTFGIDKWLPRLLDPKLLGGEQETPATRAFVLSAVPALRQVRDELLLVSDKFALSNGSADSQLGRLKKVLDFRLDHPIDLETKYDATGLQDVRDYCNMRIPFRRKSNFALSSTNLFKEAVRHEVYAAERNSERVVGELAMKTALFRVNTNSDSGFATKNLKNGEVFATELLLGSLLLKDLDENKDVSRWESMIRLAALKPKFEIIEKEKVLERIRNIMCVSSATERPMQAIHRTIEKVTFKECVDKFEDFGYRSLKGFSPFKGYFSRFFTFIGALVAQEGPMILFYADNLFYVDKDLWVSLDGKTFEAQFTRPTCHRLLRRIEEALPEGTHPAFKKYLRVVQEPSLLDTVVTLGNQQFELNCLPSGRDLTYEANEERMASIGYVWETLGKPAPVDADGKMTDAFKRVLTNSYSDLRIERIARGWQVGSHDLDLLGFRSYELDLTPLGLAPRKIAVLQKERILKALAFDKSDANKELSPIHRYAARLMKYRCLYLVGGAVYKDLAYALITFCLRVYESMRFEFGERTVMIALTELDDLLESRTFGEGLNVNLAEMDLLRTAVLSLDAPTPFEFLKLHLSQSDVDKIDLSGLRSGKMYDDLFGWEIESDLSAEPDDVLTPDFVFDEEPKRGRPKVVAQRRQSVSSVPAFGAPLPSGMQKTNVRKLKSGPPKAERFNSIATWEGMNPQQKAAQVNMAVGYLNRLKQLGPSFLQVTSSTEREPKVLVFDIAKPISQLTGLNMMAVVEALKAVQPRLRNWTTSGRVEEANRNKLALALIIKKNLGKTEALRLANARSELRYIELSSGLWADVPSDLLLDTLEELLRQDLLYGADKAKALGIIRKYGTPVTFDELWGPPPQRVDDNDDD